MLFIIKRLKPNNKIIMFCKFIHLMINSTIYKDIDYHFTFNYTPTFEKVYSQNIRTDFYMVK